MPRKAQETIELIDNKGRVLKLPAKTKISDLAKLGVVKFKIEPASAPIQDGWFVSIDKTVKPT